jgi:hypothetical protein
LIRFDIKNVLIQGGVIFHENPHQPVAQKQYSSKELLTKMSQSFSKSDKLLAQLQTALSND